MYYLRTRPAANAIAFTIAKDKAVKQTTASNEEAMVCSLNDPEGCISCSG